MNIGILNFDYLLIELNRNMMPNSEMLRTSSVLPDPSSPAIPTISPFLMENEMSWSTSGPTS